jgi:hypothetical protein
MATGATPTIGVPFIGPLLLLVVGVYRCWLVLQSSGSLGSFALSGFPLLLRRVGVGALYVGGAIAVVNLMGRPLMMLLLTQRTESGAEFFVVGYYLSFVGGLGVVGLILFELSRIVGFEKHARATPS